MSVDLKRPLAVFDLETTGTDPQSDKIVEIALIRVDVSGERRATTRRINPGRPIPKEATAVHGIGDADGATAPLFRDIARELLPMIEDQEWFFDTELLLLAEHNGLRIHEVPVDWVDDADSRVDVVGTAAGDAFYTIRRVPRMPTKEEEGFFKRHNKRPTSAGTE